MSWLFDDITLVNIHLSNYDVLHDLNPINSISICHYHEYRVQIIVINTNVDTYVGFRKKKNSRP